jgi:hypothetical protein
VTTKTGNEVPIEIIEQEKLAKQKKQEQARKFFEAYCC